jgi:hypothetical protein
MIQLDGERNKMAEIETVTESIAEVMVPSYLDDTKKSIYLRERIAGFSVRESMERANCSMRSVKRWREFDPEFNRLDTIGLIEARKKLNTEYLNIEFSRNFRMVLQKDFDILIKSLQNKELSPQEHQYLLKLRNHYTPQQLALIKQLVNEAESPEGFNFTSLTFEIRREKEQITIKAGTDGMPQLS